jgi:hypothetical protein
MGTPLEGSQHIALCIPLDGKLGLRDATQVHQVLATIQPPWPGLRPRVRLRPQLTASLGADQVSSS